MCLYSAHAAIAAVALASASPALADARDWDRASTAVEWALVAAAAGAPLLEDDRQGVYQAGGSVAAALLTSEALKRAIPETRPDGSDRYSFPSSHTAVSFAAAASLQQRQGWSAGVPAHIAAAFVGVARVEADKHYWHDVVAGAAIGELAGLLITRQRQDQVVVVPWGDAHGGGVSIAARF